MSEQNILRATGLLVINVKDSNPNGDPDRESDPRQRPDGKGESKIKDATPLTRAYRKILLVQ